LIIVRAAAVPFKLQKSIFLPNPSQKRAWPDRRQQHNGPASDNVKTAESFSPSGSNRKPVAIYFDASKAAAPLIAGFTGMTQLGEGDPGYARVGVTLF